MKGTELPSSATTTTPLAWHPIALTHYTTGTLVEMWQLAYLFHCQIYSKQHRI